MTKLYTSKVPSSVREAMLGLTKDECYLVKRRKKGLTGKGIQGNCHFNVQNWVDSIGGERIAGWLLYRNKSFVNKGIWLWSFHSVWKTPEGQIVDVTQDKTYEGSDYTTMWFEKERDIDLVEGISYNNIVVFENNAIAQTYSQTLRTQIEVGTAYWATSRLQYILDVEAHSGKYRWIDDAYPNNLRMLEEEYDCKADNGRLVPNKGAASEISAKIFFDYSVGG